MVQACLPCTISNLKDGIHYTHHACRLGGAEELSADTANQDLGAAKQFWTQAFDGCACAWHCKPS